MSKKLKNFLYRLLVFIKIVKITNVRLPEDHSTMLKAITAISDGKYGKESWHNRIRLCVGPFGSDREEKEWIIRQAGDAVYYMSNNPIMRNRK